MMAAQLQLMAQNNPEMFMQQLQALGIPVQNMATFGSQPSPVPTQQLPTLKHPSAQYPPQNSKFFVQYHCFGTNYTDFTKLSYIYV